MKVFLWVVAACCFVCIVGFPVWMVHHLNPVVGLTFENILGDAGPLWLFSGILIGVTTSLGKKKSARIILFFVFTMFCAVFMAFLTITFVKHHHGYGRQLGHIDSKQESLALNARPRFL